MVGILCVVLWWLVVLIFWYVNVVLCIMIVVFVDVVWVCLMNGCGCCCCVFYVWSDNFDENENDIELFVDDCCVG